MGRIRKHISRPDFWTAVFTGILALSTLGALWYAHDQIGESRHQAQIEHLLVLVHEFDQEPMATYRRGLAQKRLDGTDADPLELYRVLDFFETVGLLVDRGYLHDEDVWYQFGYWILNINADADMRANINYEEKRNPNEYATYLSLVKRLQEIDAAHGGYLSHVSRDDVMNFYREELKIVGGLPVKPASRVPSSH